MLTVQEMTCKECGRSDSTEVTMVVARGAKTIVQFRVDCEVCGSFSHYLPYTEVNRAVRRYLDEGRLLDVRLPAAQRAGQEDYPQPRPRRH